jgi:TMEM189-like protein
MGVLALPQKSRITVGACIAVQAYALYTVASHRPGLWLTVALSVVAFFVGGFVTDLISGLAHFGFDYVWPARMPILGPISVEFRQHHEDPTLDPSAVLTNFTKGAYGALPFAVITWLVARTPGDSAVSFLVDSSLMATSLWMLGFHQIHSYAHMGSRLSPEEFNRAVAEISRIPNRRQQKEEFAKLFEAVGIPPFVRFLQRCRLFLRPEEHWRHHDTFESDFSSVNGWSDPVMNWFYGPIARRKKAREEAMLAAALPPSEA